MTTDERIVNLFCDDHMDHVEETACVVCDRAMWRSRAERLDRELRRLREAAEHVGAQSMLTLDEAEGYGRMGDGHLLKPFLRRTAAAHNALRGVLRTLP